MKKLTALYIDGEIWVNRDALVSILLRAAAAMPDRPSREVLSAVADNLSKIKA